MTTGDHGIRPCRELTRLPWWRPRLVRSAREAPAADPVCAAFLPLLLAAFERQGHPIGGPAGGPADVLIACATVPDGDEPLRERIPELPLPLACTLGDRGDRLGLLVTLVAVPERLSKMPHGEVVETARTLMARVGTPVVVFLSGDKRTGRLHESTYCTLEGGHPSDLGDAGEVVERVRDRITTTACARDVGRDYEIEEDVIPVAAWAAGTIPGALARAGRRMAYLGLLPPPRQIGDYTSAYLAKLYELYFDLRGFSEGMLFAYDPELQVLMTTASGTWGVDKRALARDDIVAIRGGDGGRLRVLAPEGRRPKGPSVEAQEVHALLTAAPSVRLARTGRGWVPSAAGERTVPIIRAGMHAHVGVAYSDHRQVETVPVNRADFPYGFGCGTDLMAAVARDVVRRSRAINDPADPRRYVRWHLLYHGEMAVELWKPGLPDRPLDGLLDLYDPDQAYAVRHDLAHIQQPA